MLKTPQRFTQQTPQDNTQHPLQTTVASAKAPDFMRHKQRGASTVDVMIAAGFVIGALVFTISIYPRIVNSANISQFQVDAAVISSAAERWKKARSNYTGVSMAVLCAQNILTKNGSICGSTNTGANTNAFGGSWTLAPAANPGLYTVTGTLPNDPDVIAELADAMAPTTRGNCQSATGCNTLSTTATGVSMTY
jgi:hypothetical protein